MTTTILTPTKATGAISRRSEVLYVDPACRTDEAEVAAPFAEGVGNPAFLADLLSAMLTHERCGVHLYRSVAERTLNPVLQRRYRQFLTETEEHVAVLTELIEGLDGIAGYVSPMARAIEGMDTALVESTYRVAGTADEMVTEMVMLDAVFLAETMCHANWSTLSRLCESALEGDVAERVRAAVERVEDQEDEHLAWARDTKAKMTELQARSSVAARAGAAAEGLAARIRNWFSDES